MNEALQQVGDESEVAGEVRARRFTLVDRRGNPRAELACGGDNAAALRLYDLGEQPRVSLAVDVSGAAHLKLHDEDGEVCAWVSVDANGSPSVYLCGMNRFDRAAKGHAGLSVDDHGAPALSLHDKHGQPRVLLSLGEQDGTPVLSFSDAEGRLRALLSEDADAEPSAAIRHHNGNGNGHEYGLADDAGIRGPLLPEPPPIETDQIIRSVMAPEMRRVLERLDSAERKSRRAHLLAAALVVVVASGAAVAGARIFQHRRPTVQPGAEPAAQAGATAADQPGRVLEAEEVVVKDKEGGTRARLGTMPDGAPFLQIMGKDGQGFAEVAILPGVGTSLRLGDGRSLISAKVAEDGGSELALYGKGEKARAAVTVAADGLPTLGFTDDEGRVRAGLSLAPDGSPSLSLYDKDGLRAVLGSSAQSSSLVLLNREGRVIYQAPR